jgi:hypothetical protein
VIVRSVRSIRVVPDNPVNFARIDPGSRASSVLLDRILGSMKLADRQATTSETFWVFPGRTGTAATWTIVKIATLPTGIETAIEVDATLIDGKIPGTATRATAATIAIGRVVGATAIGLELPTGSAAIGATAATAIGFSATIGGSGVTVAATGRSGVITPIATIIRGIGGLG